MSCLTSEDGHIHVCRVDGEWTRSKRRARTRFCFGCRKRTMYRLWIFFPEPFSYYDPNFMWKCDQCKKELDLFPGMDRTWGEP